jgi:hypothetical protein
MRHNNRRFAWNFGTTAVIIFGLLFLTFASGQTGANTATTAIHKKLSHNELKNLIATAKTREDHLRIADYYRGEATHLRKEAAEHEDLATAYAKGTIWVPSKLGLLQHCKEFAQSFARAAEEADALASDHQKIADEIKQ